MKRKSYRVIVSVLVTIEIISVFLMYKSVNNKYFETTKKIENETSRKNFATYKQKDDGYEKYYGHELNIEGYTLNIDKSSCVDDKGVKKENAIQLKDGKATVESGITLYCTLYYDINKTQ